MIRISNLRLSLGGREIFSDISWDIPTGARIGLVGDNGTGKTTLLRVIVGQVEPDGGRVEIPRVCRSIGYLPQDLVELEDIPLIDFLKKRCGIASREELVKSYEERLAACACSLSAADGDDEEAREAVRGLMAEYEAALEMFRAEDGYAFHARAGEILGGLGFRRGDHHRPCGEFSGGWKMRILLAVILLSRPEIILLDEPTNHLDTESMEWLEGFLGGYRGTIVTVSHDRVFLDKIVDVVAELAQGRIRVFKGNYSAYLREKERRKEALEREAAQRETELERTRAFIERFRYKATKARQVQSRIRMLERLAPLETEREGPTVRIRFPEVPKSGKNVVTLEGVGKAYGDLTVFTDFSYRIDRGRKIALVGVNGAGKSTLARIIAGVEEPSWGAVTYGGDVRIAFFSQESADNLDYGRTVWEETAAVPFRGTDQQRRDLLGAFLFPGETVAKPVSVLSGGEKSRLALLKVLLQESNLLVLDEPTNHLDLRTKEIFQEALLEYGGTVVIVSHDRYFLDRLVDGVLEVREGAVRPYEGNYTYFIEKRRREEGGVPPPSTPGVVYRAPKKGEEKRARREEELRRIRARRESRRRLEEVEGLIAAAEERKKTVEEELCREENLRNPALIRELHREHRLLEETTTSLYERWEELMAEVEKEDPR